MLKNYRPISLLPIFGEKKLREYFSKTYLTTLIKNNFLQMPIWILTGDSCISQLLSIVHDINSSYDCHPMINVRGVFLDISKAFDNVWHDGILLKLETYSVERKLLNFIKKLHTRYQRVVLNGQTSTWELVKSGVPQEFVIGPLMFLLYIMINDLQDKWFTIINDLQDNIRSTCKTFADDTLFFSMFLIKTLGKKMNWCMIYNM